ncbi:ImmA/IrrE family metallo-endopeptidase [Neobacillus sp. YIM B06451]|uniref:ImmA/IrrE family metallo-endopeptidase n=1 Tax=Neobacillus sp. YIM B06451 TaxID=3070994 RepID=UPI00292E247C|nr:ImmA/IrrE family metallo-endopeptidase [Neobacillus sp. YIM B06451]
MSKARDREEELLRMEIKDKVDTVRYYWSKKGLTDIFDILEHQAIIIRKPKLTSNVDDLFSGFTTYIDDHFIVYINTAHTLGRQRFTAAHELYHLEYDRDLLTKEKATTEKELKTNDKYADRFATEFLMPEDAVNEYVLRELADTTIQPEHVVRMMYYFKVSYRAMVNRLFSLGYIDTNQADALKSISSKENAGVLSTLVKSQGLEPTLITKTQESSISKKYLHYLFDNYRNKKIAYGRVKSTLEYIGRTPEEYGIYPPDET